jgi:hypothetical protein
LIQARLLSLAVTLGLLATFAAGCGGTSAAPRRPASSQRTALIGYLRQVEPIRLAVNKLLEGADPILAANHRRRISARQAAGRMEGLERRFAGYAVEVAAITPATSELRALNAPYAHTYILEDSYLSALTVGLAEHDFDALPNTQSEQRAAIIQWRTGLAVLAKRAGVTLPGDLQVAGRGEIAPSPDGS